MATGSTKQQREITATVDGKDWGVFDTLTGGAVDSDDNKYKPGAMGPEISLGTQSTVTNVVIGRLYDLQRDHAKAAALARRVGKANVVVKDHPLDPDGNPFGKPRVYSGKLKTVTYPEADSNSSDPAILTIEVTPNGTVG